MRLTNKASMLYYLGFLPLHRIAFVKWFSRFITGISKMLNETYQLEMKIRNISKRCKYLFSQTKLMSSSNQTVVELNDLNFGWKIVLPRKDSVLITLIGYRTVHLERERNVESQSCIYISVHLYEIYKAKLRPSERTEFLSYKRTFNN